ncbi:3-deoxy-manno-octulosonate cytidylyltransferase [Clostridium saudiense]|uniref:3-deoxy-manno-octulosonate cytidylyltransferase n=1 Tax=Clostridium saudiense TaxID=1414720 RepID=UPI0008212D21|nr:3-deoxy-manno-octulosonate cytidylyltransferase [Clostridium saudiense]MDU7455586.1 3-deoxy-manno-octulosonate cytidylyltransferase [Clostridium saudiense]SCJ99652.1 3-deoxy-manno-octulosonate cytidylyltransferase [uncultured Clostridium sp.]
MKIIGIIPARYKSTRFEGKPLADICGKPMVWWVYNQVRKVKELNEVYVATDDERIVEVCKKMDINYIMTKNNHGTSTERLFEVAQNIDSDYYLCINGDEPLIEPTIISKILDIQKSSSEKIYVANLMTTIKDPVEVIDNTNIKVVTDKYNNAIYMSRSAIPHPKSSMEFQYKKHLGVLLYNYEALKFFSETKRDRIESIEDINELRFIENGKKIKMIEVNAETLSVDTPKDLEKVKSIIKQRDLEGEKANE